MYPSRAMIYKRDKNTCQYCGAKSKLTIDHVVPRCRGGGNTWDNMVVACSSCNTRKGDKLLEQTNMKLRKKPRAPISKVMMDLEETKVSQWRDFYYG